ncbi:hypothetical protein DICVIV_01937 [Dictyocaulus viviparus]|uniref:Uncharacterized protein n=1 Tax=Dictyocaulus viviparus TaxID=29172 RepID=A0A0D8Y4R7_DICVI|nr:hypothetical protein DICVIV_01937 [Dictyocaulus viviparus]
MRGTSPQGDLPFISKFIASLKSLKPEIVDESGLLSPSYRKKNTYIPPLRFVLFEWFLHEKLPYQAQLVIHNITCEDPERGVLAEIDSVNVRGQLNVVDETEPVSSGDGENHDEKLFEQLPSLRIAREYLRRKIAAERELEHQNG